MRENVITVDDQPISATFFGEGRWLTSFITPKSLEVQVLLKHLTAGITDFTQQVVFCRDWVAQNLRYVETVNARISIGGSSSHQSDYWTDPGLAIKTLVGNCAVKAFLLTSLLRNLVSEDSVYCVLGNLYGDNPGGHAWVTISLAGKDFILEATRPDIPALIPEEIVHERYEAVHYFNDKKVLAVPGRTQMEFISRKYLDKSFYKC